MRRCAGDVPLGVSVRYINRAGCECAQGRRAGGQTVHIDVHRKWLEPHIQHNTRVQRVLARAPFFVITLQPSSASQSLRCAIGARPLRVLWLPHYRAVGLDGERPMRWECGDGMAHTSGRMIWKMIELRRPGIRHTTPPVLDLGQPASQSACTFLPWSAALEPMIRAGVFSLK